MKDVLCIYYSRTGNTKKAMEEIAQDLDAELAELHDDVDRSGLGGWLRSGLDAMRRTTRPVTVETQRPLKDYLKKSIRHRLLFRSVMKNFQC